MAIFDGKVAAITGAGTGGMGARVAELLAANGAKVVVNDLRKELADEVVNGIIARGGCAVANYGNVAEEKGGLVETAIASYSRIDILINCAGITCPKHFIETTQEEFLRELNVHVMGTFTTCKAAVPQMIKQGGGRIINISSRAAFFGAVDVGYSAAKGAIASMTLCMANDLREYGIAANVIIPSAQTKLFSDDPAGRPAAPDGIPASFAFDPRYLAPAFAWLSSDEYAKGVTGQIIYTCGGDIVVHAHPTKINDYPIVVRKPDIWTVEELGKIVTPMILQKNK